MKCFDPRSTYVYILFSVKRFKPAGLWTLRYCHNPRLCAESMCHALNVNIAVNALKCCGSEVAWNAVQWHARGEITPLLQPLFLGHCPSCFHVSEPVTRDHSSWKTTPDEALSITFPFSPLWTAVPEGCCRAGPRLPKKFVTERDQFSPSTDWAVAETWGRIRRRLCPSLFCRRPFWAVLA